MASPIAESVCASAVHFHRFPAAISWASGNTYGGIGCAASRRRLLTEKPSSNARWSLAAPEQRVGIPEACRVAVGRRRSPIRIHPDGAAGDQAARVDADVNA